MGWKGQITESSGFPKCRPELASYQYLVIDFLINVSPVREQRHRSKGNRETWCRKETGFHVVSSPIWLWKENHLPSPNPGEGPGKCHLQSLVKIQIRLENGCDQKLAASAQIMRARAHVRSVQIDFEDFDVTKRSFSWRNLRADGWEKQQGLVS